LRRDHSKCAAERSASLGRKASPPSGIERTAEHLVAYRNIQRFPTVIAGTRRLSFGGSFSRLITGLHPKLDSHPEAGA
jgi:hypothetical protein